MNGMEVELLNYYICKNYTKNGELLQFSRICDTLRADRGTGAQVCDCKCDWLWLRIPLEGLKYLFKCIFSFLRSCVEADSCIRRGK